MEAELDMATWRLSAAAAHLFCCCAIQVCLQKLKASFQSLHSASVSLAGQLHGDMSGQPMH